jgi:hypothetical protein
MQKKYSGAVLLLLFLVVAGYFAAQKKSDLLTISCLDLSKVCSVTAGLNISTDHPPQTMRPFKLLINAPEMTPIAASFAMQGMDMGLNRYRLIKQENGRWAADVTLPVCIQGRSSWLLQLEMEMHNKQRRYHVAFNSR